MIKTIMVCDSIYDGETITYSSWWENDCIVIERKKKDGRLIDLDYRSKHDGLAHRTDGPAKLFYYYRKGVEFIVDHYYIRGDYIGSGKEGFWALWNLSDEKVRASTSMLKDMLRHA
jgi:hypothetical protein